MCRTRVINFYSVNIFVKKYSRASRRSEKIGKHCVTLYSIYLCVADEISDRESLISRRLVLFAVAVPFAEESPWRRVNVHNFTPQRPLGIGLLDRISRRKEEEARQSPPPLLRKERSGCP